MTQSTGRLEAGPRPATPAEHAPRLVAHPATARRRRRRLAWAGAAAALLVTLWLARVPLLVAVGDFLFVRDPLVPADAMVVLGGEIEARPAEAARLYARGLAPRVLVVGMMDGPEVELGVFPSETEATVRLLAALGVPRSAIEVVPGPGPGASSTTDEAQAMREYVASHGTRRLIAVTSWYHTRRTRWNLRRALDGQPVTLLMAGAPSLQFSERDWWRSEDGMIRVFEEYLKFVHNWLYR